MIFINQLRMKIGVMYGNPETTTGGNALKFYASVRLDIRRTGQIKERDEIIGNTTRVKDGERIVELTLPANGRREVRWTVRFD